jgi:hypothetical protein
MFTFLVWFHGNNTQIPATFNESLAGGTADWNTRQPLTCIDAHYLAACGTDSRFLPSAFNEWVLCCVSVQQRSTVRN